MKKTLLLTALAVLATGAFGQSQLDLTLTAQVPDLNAAPVNKLANNGDQKSKKAPYLDTNVKYTFSAKLDDVNTVKLGAAVDLYTPFFSGTSDPYKTQLAAKVIEPFIQYQGLGLDILNSVAVYTFSPSDTSSGSAAVGFYTGPFFGNNKAKDNTFPVSHYLKASYKYSVDKTLAFVAGVETDSGVAPVFFVLDAKPQASVIWTFLQFDTKYNLTYKPKSGANNTDSYLTTYLEPKATVDFTGFDASLKGLKAYAGGKFILSNGAVNGKLTGSSLTPGISYSLGLGTGTLGLDTSLGINGIGTDDVADNTFYNFNFKASYSYKF